MREARACKFVVAHYNPQMHLYLQTPPGAGAAPRYCRIALEQDLLGGWTLYRESGTEGGRATLKRESAGLMKRCMCGSLANSRSR